MTREAMTRESDMRQAYAQVLEAFREAGFEVVILDFYGNVKERLAPVRKQDDPVKEEK